MNLFEFAPTCRPHYSLANHFNGLSIVTSAVEAGHSLDYDLNRYQPWI